MKRTQFEQYLAQSFDDHQLSRSERRVLSQILAENSISSNDASWIQQRAFQMTDAVVGTPKAHRALEWLEEVVKLLQKSQSKTSNKKAIYDALFSPGDAPLKRIVSLFSNARKSIDCCVFTITDDRISQAILDAHRRGIQVRVMTDNDKATDYGSDAVDLGRNGVPVKYDKSDHHMHHKYAVFDRVTLLTGSYNWTRSAAKYNQENIVVTTHQSLVTQFSEHFEALWQA